ncbi:MAG: efflux RND transporter periplasmic adaptor subunit [Acidobacteria bacterium]|nr:efflux RND transporter periplasmic adaptor subunit [Acidobacteriota bacterium]
MKVSRLLTLVAGPLTLSAVVACGGGSAPQAAAPVAVPPVDVAAVTAQAGTLEATLELSGNLAPRARVGVKPRVPGAIERVLVDIGAAVREGQTLATIDRREIDAQADAATASVAVATAGVDAAEAGLSNATTELERARNLFEKGALPRQRLDAADTANKAALAQRELARASLAQAQAAQRRAREVQRDTTLTSPVAGHVVERNYDPGAMPGDLPVVVIADLRVLKLEAGVSELEAGRLKVGMPAEVIVQARSGEKYVGELAAIAPEVNERNRHFRIEIRVPNPEAVLLSGMYATARIVTERATGGVIVPREAVTTRAGKRVALVVTGDTVKAVDVTEGLSDGQRIQILTGLKAGDTVVADARRQLADGTRVRTSLN